ncbi:hypothetical protein D3C81_393000 [compost metagenome]
MHFQRAFQAIGQRLDGAPCFRRPHQVHRVGRRAADGGRPRGAPVRVGQHLDFIDDGHFDDGFRVQHFHRAGDMRGAIDDAALLARDQADGQRLAVRRSFLQALVVFQGQQAQGRQVDAAFCLDQRFHGAVRLARIGRAQQGDEAARQAARHLERGRILGQVDALARARRMLLFLLAFDGVVEALADAVKYHAGRLGRLHVAQGVQEDHRVRVHVLAQAGNIGDEIHHVLAQFVEDGHAGPLAYQGQLGFAVHLAPLGRPRQHALRGHQRIRHHQVAGLDHAGKAHEDAAFHLHQADMFGQLPQFRDQGGVVIVFGGVGKIAGSVGRKCGGSHVVPGC